MPTILHLDLTMSGCHYAALNRRYGGTLASYPKERYVSLQLQSFNVGVGKSLANYDIKATLRR